MSPKANVQGSILVMRNYSCPTRLEHFEIFPTNLQVYHRSDFPYLHFPDQPRVTFRLYASCDTQTSTPIPRQQFLEHSRPSLRTSVMPLIFAMCCATTGIIPQCATLPDRYCTTIAHLLLPLKGSGAKYGPSVSNTRRSSGVLKTNHPHIRARQYSHSHTFLQITVVNE